MSEPPFEGELLGIFIAPHRHSPKPDPVPDTFLKPEDVCPPDARSVEIPWEEAGEMALDLSLPTEYVLQAGSENTGAFACGGRVTAVNRHYTLGTTAEIVIGRSVLRLHNYNVAADRVRTAVFAGREAVVIEPAFPSGRGQLIGAFYGDSERSGVFFPEPFGQTYILAAGLSTENLIKLAQLVAEATKR